MYEYSNIDLHIFTTNICKFQLEDFNHKTHPDLKAIEAIYMSSTVPIVFKPLSNNPLYLDGGFLNLYPVEYCIDKYDNEKILGIIITDECDTHGNAYTTFNNILEYLGYIVERIHNYLIKKNNYTLKYELVINCTKNSMSELKELFVHKENRKKMIDSGNTYAEEFINAL